MDCPHLSESMRSFNHLLAETDAIYHQAARKLGLSDSAMIILYSICNLEDRCLLRDLVHLSGISKQTINSTLRKLEAENILYLENSGGKRKIVCLTEKGKEIIRHTVSRLITAENEILASWTEEEWQTYVMLTKKYCLCLKEKVKEL